MKLKKVKIIIQSEIETKKLWKSALNIETKSIQPSDTLIFTSLRSVAKVFSPVRLELIGVILKNRPESIYQLAKILNRDFKNVHSDVKLLEKIGFLELRSVQENDALKPIALYSGYELNLAA